MNNDYDNRIYTIFNRVLHISASRLSERSRRGDLEEWDSLAHILLIVALSEEFDITISAEKALDMETIKDVKRIITELMSEFSD